MKSTKKFSLLFIVSLALTLLVIPSCTENDKEQKKETSDSQLLVVERQYVDWNDNYKSIDIAIDVPIKGPKPLLDSLKTFLFELQSLHFYEDDDTLIWVSMNNHC